MANDTGRTGKRTTITIDDTLRALLDAHRDAAPVDDDIDDAMLDALDGPCPGPVAALRVFYASWLRRRGVNVPPRPPVPPLEVRAAIARKKKRAAT